MKFTSEDLMKAMGLQIGDKIRIISRWFNYSIFTLVEDKEVGILLKCNEKSNNNMLLENLVDEEYEILPKIKKVGDLKCKETDCRKCPLKYLCRIDNVHNVDLSLFKVLEAYRIDDQEIYDLLKARLDKEVNNND